MRLFDHHHSNEQAAIRTDLGAIFVPMELSRSIWFVASLSPGAGEKMSKYSVKSGYAAKLLARLTQLKEKALARTGRVSPIIVIQASSYAARSPVAIHLHLFRVAIESPVGIADDVIPPLLCLSDRKWRAFPSLQDRRWRRPRRACAW